MRAAALHVAWILIALLAHATGAVPVSGASTFILGAAGLLALGVYLSLGGRAGHGVRIDDPRSSPLATGQALAGIAWATLYGWCTAPAGALLAIGMYATGVALAVPAVTVPVLARIAALAVAASATTAILDFTALGFAALLPSFGLAALLAATGLAARTFARTRAELRARNSELQTNIEHMARRAERDHLTNSYNRQSILDMVGREKARAERAGESLCICLLDIDHFKDMNDRHGHLAGDRVLAAFARRIRGALRAMDLLNGGGLSALEQEQGVAAAAGRSALGRVGGEEFIVVLPGTSLRGALRCAERMRKAVVRRPFDGVHQVTVSIGIAEYRPGESVSSLIGRADQALYGAKNAGRNRVHCATEDGPNAIVMPDMASQ